MSGQELAMQLPWWLWHPIKQQAERRAVRPRIPARGFNLSLALWPEHPVFNIYEEEIIGICNTLICMMYRPHLKPWQITIDCEQFVQHVRHEHECGMYRGVHKYIFETYMEELTSSRYRAWRTYQHALWFAVE
jgi:hypothetical protein